MNLFDLSDLPLDKELITVLAELKSTRIERIISTGQISDWYDQTETEFVALLMGKAKLQFEDGRIITLFQGDTLVLKSHEKHKVVYTSCSPPCVWLCVFLGGETEDAV